MHRLLILLLLFVSAGLSGPAAAQTGTAEGLPPRPAPFRFVNDQAQLMAPADVKKLENGLRRYADNNGTQIVVVTVPTLGGREVADYGRALGTAWGIGQRDKNNGVVVLLSAQDHKLTIQPGSGVKDRITPEVTSRAIGQMTPGFKQGNYFAGLRAGLNTLMLAANPSSVSQATSPTSTSTASPGTGAGVGAGANLNNQARTPVSPTPNDPLLTPPTTEPDSGPGMGTVLLIALVVGGIIWLLVRMLRSRRQAAAPSGTSPDFLPNRNPGGSPNGPGNMQRGGSNFGGGGGGNFGGGGMGGGMGGMGGGSGMGGILATGAAAAAGAYLGNRMASGHEAPSHGLTSDGTTPQHFDPNTAAGAAGATGAGAMGTGAADDYFSSRDSGVGNTAPDYFADDTSAANSSTDFFSSDDNSSYDDTSSGDMGGGGFDSGDDNSGSW